MTFQKTRTESHSHALQIGISRDGLKRKARKRCNQRADLKRKAGPQLHLSRGHAQTTYFFLRPSRIFKNERVRISASVRPVASASCSLMAPQLRPRRK